MEITFHDDATEDTYAGFFRALAGWTVAVYDVEVDKGDDPLIGEVDAATDGERLRVTRYVGESGESTEHWALEWPNIRRVEIL